MVRKCIYKVLKNEQRLSIPKIYIKNIAIVFSLISTIFLLIFLIAYPLVIGFYGSIFLITLIATITSLLSFILNIVDKIRISSILFFTGLQFFWVVYPYHVTEGMPFSVWDAIWIINILNIVIVILSGFMINKTASVIFSIIPVINNIIIGLLNNDKSFFIYKFPFIFLAFALAGVFTYYLIMVQTKITNILSKYSQSLKDSEEKYKTLFNASINSIFIETLDGKIVDSNDSACRIYGYTKDEFKNMTVFDIVPEDLAKTLRSSFTYEVKTNITPVPSMGRRKDGTSFPIEVSTKLTQIKGKTYVIAYVYDMTARRLAEEEIKKQNALLDEVFNAIQEGIQIVDENEVIIFSNLGASHIFEVDTEGLIGKSLLDFLDVDAKKVVKNETKKRKLRQSSTYELPIVTGENNKKFVRVNATPRFNSQGKFKGAFGSIVDITYQRKAEQALKESEEKYRTLVENSSDAILLIQKETILFFNKKALSLWEYTEEEFNNLPIKNLLSEEDKYITNDENTINEILNYKDKKFELRIITKNNKKIWVKVSTVLTQWEGKRALLCFISDITEQKRAEQKLIEAKERAEETSHLKSRFIANVSHELRTPLNSIMGFSQLMIIKKDLPSEERVKLNRRIFKSSKILHNLINNILNFSSIEDGKPLIAKEYFDLRNTIEEVVNMFEENIKQKNINFNSFIENALPRKIYTDKQRLQQILINLINNAVKFSEKDGPVFLKVEKFYDSDNISKKIKFTIKDKGIGIDEEKRNLLFRPFTQIDSSSTRKYGGVGLGLSIVKNLTELLGGEIWFESEFGKGSTFYFTISIRSSS
jgi:PAS domain S-box-containing protein